MFSYGKLTFSIPQMCFSMLSFSCIGWLVWWLFGLVWFLVFFFFGIVLVIVSLLSNNSENCSFLNKDLEKPYQNL